MDSEWSFLSVDLELTNRCTEGCAMCPRNRLSRPPGCMTPEVFAVVVKVLRQFGSRVTFSGFGNPTLHPRWAEYVSVVRDAGLPAGLVLHPAALSPEVIELLAMHPPSHLEISFPSIDPAEFFRLCPQTDYETALDRVVILHRRRLAPMVCVGLQTAGGSGARQYRDFWKVYGIRTRYFPCHSRGGHLRDHSLTTATPVASATCGLLALHAFIAWNGDLLACCHDLTGETRFGNLASDDPWHLARLKAHYAAGPPWQLCRCCDEFRKGWSLPEGPCPHDPGARGRRLGQKTSGK